MLLQLPKLNALMLIFPLATPPAFGGNAAFTGAEVYAQSCAMCHAKGVAGAPRIGEIDAWRSRAEKGRADLLLSILRGKGGMPPKGGNASLSVNEANAALDYMLSSSVR